ncbi:MULTISPECIES: PepSY-associated TM helix domain-containing protein [Nocardioides]|uniref:PepSY-associated TM helix domain-containing protein n=1 Tax=Nocardioides TaxID=1839 RepID=UPI0003309875|nr:MULTISPECIES: PepSY-associated TM helix domain-containing protein [Nocardioides]EON22124.1 hypothetical protein CF8_4059 [Nocardioides sp. CF8]
MAQTLVQGLESGTASPRRRPGVRPAVAAAHRWTSIVVAGFLIVIMTSGVPLLFGSEIFRVSNPEIYQATSSDSPLTPQQALEVVNEAHPEFVAGNVIDDEGVYLVTDSRLNQVYGVDAGSGEITGEGSYYGGFPGLMENLHAFGLSSPRFPGYVPWLGEPIPTLGVDSLEGTTRGVAIVGVVGILAVLLVISGVYLWWPGLRRIGSGFRIRRSSARYVRHREVHKVVGIISVPFMLMWAFTGAAAQFPQLQQGLMTITGGEPDQLRRVSWDFASVPGAETIGLDEARAAALTVVPGDISNHTLPDPEDPAAAYLFEISGAGGVDPYDNAILHGNDWVYVDKYDPSHTKVVYSGDGVPVQNRFYEEAVYPSHFGWYVPTWARVLWAVFGLAPAVLFTTGLISWGIRARKRRARRARATA